MHSRYKIWMTSNFLLLNSEKTEVLIIGPKPPTSNNLEHCLTLDGCSVDSLSSVRNLGVLFDSNLSFDSHVSSIYKTAFFHLKNISKLGPMLSMSNADKLINAFMTSRLDYCNALLGGCSARLINKLQMVQNAAARVLTRTRKYDHISPVLSTLHWLPTKHRIDFKILLITYKALNGLAPQYLSELLLHYRSPRPLRSGWQSRERRRKLPRTAGWESRERRRKLPRTAGWESRERRHKLPRTASMRARGVRTRLPRGTKHGNK